MRKSLLVAASLFAAATSATTFAEFAKASPQFKVTAASPGAIDFTGSGTAQFNNSIGTNNSFQVGSSTNLGVNASASSTPEYGVTGTARLDLAGTTTMKQVIGTSGAHQDTTNKASAAYTVAHQAASDRAHEVGSSSQRSGKLHQNLHGLPIEIARSMLVELLRKQMLMEPKLEKSSLVLRLLISMVQREIGVLQGSLPMTLLMRISTVQNTLLSGLDH